MDRWASLGSGPSPSGSWGSGIMSPLPFPLPTHTCLPKVKHRLSHENSAVAQNPVACRMMGTSSRRVLGPSALPGHPWGGPTSSSTRDPREVPRASRVYKNREPRGTERAGLSWSSMCPPVFLPQVTCHIWPADTQNTYYLNQEIRRVLGDWYQPWAGEWLVPTSCRSTLEPAHLPDALKYC